VVGEDARSGGARARLRVARRHLAKRAGMRTIRRLRGFFARQSLVGDPEVFGLEDRDAFPWIAELEAGWREIRREAEAVLEHRDALPPLHAISPDAARIAGDEWRVFMFHAFGERSERNRAACPETARLLDRVPGLENAWLSVLGPDTRVPGHKGISKGLLRYHLGLVVPERREQCRMRVGERELVWEEGRSILFDDTVKHAVWNASPDERVVLLLDVERPMRWPGRLLGRLFVAALRRHGYVRQGLRNHRRWEQRYHGGDAR
jgi:beta-hydroxylase